MSISDIPNAMALPQSVQLKLRPSAVPATRKRLNIQPYQQPGSNNPITSSQLIQFYIPARKGTMYDPQTLYLRGRISATNPENGDVFLNRNAFSLINRLQIYGQDSTLLEDIQNYNDLCHTLLDVQMSREDKYALSAMYGGSDIVSVPAYQDNYVFNVDAIGNGDTTITLDGDAVGATQNTIDEGVSDPANEPDANGLRFCIPIVSAFGLLADTMVPVGWLNSDLRFDFYTELPNVAFRNIDPAAVVSYNLADLELVVDTVEFSGESLAMVSQIAPPSAPLYCHASTYKNYTSSLPATANGFTSTLVPHRSLSVKQILQTCHYATAYNQNGYDSFHRILPCGSSNLGVQMSVGGLKVPQKAVSSYAEAFAELQKSQHSFNQLILNGSINRTEFYKFADDIQAEGDELTCKSVLGFDTEIYDKKGSTIINGSNWTGLNVFWEQNISNAGDAQAAIGGNGATLQYYVLFDTIYVVQDGLISVRF